MPLIMTQIHLMSRKWKVTALMAASILKVTFFDKDIVFILAGHTIFKFSK